VFTFNFLGVVFAHAMLLGIEMPLVSAPAIGVGWCSRCGLMSFYSIDFKSHEKLYDHIWNTTGGGTRRRGPMDCLITA